MADYAKGTTGHVLKTLKSWGVTSDLIDEMIVGCGEVHRKGKLFAYFKCFSDYPDPLFEFQEGEYLHQKFQTIVKGKFKPLFRLTLCGQENPCFHIEGDLANSHLYNFIHSQALQNYKEELEQPKDFEIPFLYSDGYANATFAGKITTIYVVFKNVCAASAFVNYLNKHYRPKPREAWDQ